MADNFTCSIDDLHVVLKDIILDPYAEGVQEGMAKGIDKTMRKMTSESKKNAPTDGGKWQKVNPPFPRNDSRDDGTFKKAISWKRELSVTGHKAIWYVKSPEHRLTHLLVHGHEQFIFGKPTGKRAKADPFLHNAYAQAERNLIDNVKEGIKKST